MRRRFFREGSARNGRQGERAWQRAPDGRAGYSSPPGVTERWAWRRPTSEPPRRRRRCRRAAARTAPSRGGRGWAPLAAPRWHRPQTAQAPALARAPRSRVRPRERRTPGVAQPRCGRPDPEASHGCAESTRPDRRATERPGVWARVRAGIACRPSRAARRPVA
eukprot:scaffold21911_cov99-Isochrysis_galbana.AAC.1